MRPAVPLPDRRNLKHSKELQGVLTYLERAEECRLLRRIARNTGEVLRSGTHIYFKSWARRATIEDAMTLEQLRRNSREQIMRLAADCGAGNVRVFGSVARGEADSRSDVDLLVDLEPGRSLLDLARLQRKLEELLTVPVDVISSRGLRDRVRETVLRDALPL